MALYLCRLTSPVLSFASLTRSLPTGSVSPGAGTFPYLLRILILYAQDLKSVFHSVGRWIRFFRWVRWCEQ
ncbi:uncharacterized protein BO66DRAFT_77985 [Aspergillus aculeatinus CBS 121060]|uniref:Uncharacterized protein n=1 Tax=Aspergillus aculeatinus CBS 121060 TaxID=1448322 RepID=A0ACD1HA38_9EURO|nr:hypothetical protein BO66DRAFT_77985 [Aspergillus aculeatinus CBS 121060]RAH70671.1 hypothetical protein BO66DRAFT_77985 [Aspergillus aculeatinus CBS 121060]